MARSFFSSVVSKPTHFLYYSMFACIVLISGLNVICEVLIKYDREDVGFSIFPFFITQKSIFQKSSRLTTRQQSFFQKIYTSHPDLYIKKLQLKEKPLDSSEKARIISELFIIDPWQRLYYDNLEYYDLKNDVGSVERELDELLAFLTQQFHTDYSREELSSERKSHFARYFVKMSSQLKQRDDVEKMSSYLHLAQHLDDWSLATANPIFLDHLSLDQQEQLQQKLSDINVDYFGDYREVYSKSLENIFLKYLQSNTYSTEKDWIVERSIAFVPKNVFNFEKRFLLKAQDLIHQGKIQEAELYILKMRQILPDDYWTNAQVGNYYLLVQDREKAMNAFRQCIQRFNYIHEDCETGLRQSEDGNFYLSPASFERVIPKIIN